MPAPDTKKLSEKIAKLLEGESQPPDAAVLLAAIEKINHRLDKLEGTSVTTHPTLHAHSQHPSLEKFSVAEAIADSIFAGIKKEKACEYELSKPCDHCSMCNSRGF